MSDYQEHQPIEQPPRRGVALIENDEDLSYMVDSNYNTITKPIMFSSIGVGSLYLRRHFEKEYEDAPAYSLDENGEIIKGKATDFFRKGYHEASLKAEGPSGSQERSDIKVNLWKGNGPVLSCNFLNYRMWDNAYYIATLEDADGRYFFLPPDPKFLKEIRVSFESMPGGELAR